MVDAAILLDCARDMDKEEAKAILAKELEVYRQRSYNDLLHLLDTQDVAEITGSSGVLYQLEFQGEWDDKQGGNLRIMGTIDDGGVRAFFPLADGFIIAPDGSSIGE